MKDNSTIGPKKFILLNLEWLKLDYLTYFIIFLNIRFLNLTLPYFLTLLQA